MVRNFLLLFLFSGFLFGQSNQPQYTAEINYYYGSILPHSPGILHLINQHPEGVLIAVNRKTFGDKEWESRLNYPDFGVTFHYQNNKNEELGDLYGLFGHYNFYFFDRSLQLRLGQGIAYNTNPYHKEKNYRNFAFSTHLMPSTFFMLNYQKENIWEGLGIKAGLFLIHHSNGTIKSPNTSINTAGANIGLVYVFDSENEREYVPKDKSDFSEPIHLNVFFRSGIQESRTIGSGQYPFYTFSVYADKKISRTSGFLAGIDVFIAEMLKREIEMISITYPEFNLPPDTDYKRIGLFGGYEFSLDRLAAEAQFGYYIYDDYKAFNSTYQRLVLKYRIIDNLYFGTGLKTHFSKAEALEFAVGMKF